MIKIVALDGYTLNPGDLSWDEIGKLGLLEVFNRSTIDQAYERIKNTEVLIVNKFVVDQEFLERCDALKLICVSATGYNNIDLEACRKLNISVCNVSNYSTTGVAQHTFALIFHWINKVGQHNKLVKKGYWSICPDFSFTVSPIHELAGKTMAIMGYGDIGKEVAKIAQAFGMKVIVSRKSNKAIDDPSITRVDLEQLLKEADILSLHTSLNEETKGIINRSALAKMKNSAILVNTGRGGLINENDLADCLLEEQIQAALLDVLVEEPATLHHPLYSVPNCIITPHLAWATVESRQRLMEKLALNIRSFINGKPINLIN